MSEILITLGCLKRANSSPIRDQLSSDRRIEEEEWDYDEQNLE